MRSDDLGLMAPTMDGLGRGVAEWRDNLLDKGLKENAGKSKVMIDNSGVKVFVNSIKWPCANGVQANYVKSTTSSVVMYVVICCS